MMRRGIFKLEWNPSHPIRMYANEDNRTSIAIFRNSLWFDANFKWEDKEHHVELIFIPVDGYFPKLAKLYF